MTSESWRRPLKSGCWWLSVLLGALGLLGCRDYFYESRAYFANTTREPIKVRVQTLLAEVDCARVKGRSAELLGRRELFGEPVNYDVAAGEALPLDLAEDDFSGSQQEHCAVVVQVLGFPDQLVFWARDASSVRTETKMAEANSSSFLAQSLALEGHGELKGLAAGQGLEVTPLPPLASGMAIVSDAPTSLGWSGASLAGSDFVLQRRDALPDGCLTLELGKDSSPSRPLFLCAPSWSFPFVIGDRLSVTFEDLAPPTSPYGARSEAPRATHLTVTKPDARIKLDIWLNASQSQLAATGRITGQTASGRHTACGAYVASTSVELPGMLLLAPGEDVERTSAGRHSHAFLGRADEVLVAPDTCGPEHSSLGTRVDLLILDTPAEGSP